MKKKGIAEIITDIRLAKYRIDAFIARVNNRIKTLENLSLYNVGRFNYLAQEYLKEIELNQNIVKNLIKLRTLLEILEIRLETFMILNSAIEYLYPVVKALESIRGSIGGSIEFGPIIDDILIYLKPIVTSKAEPILNEAEEVRKILEEAEKVAEQEMKEKYKVPS